MSKYTLKINNFIRGGLMKISRTHLLLLILIFPWLSIPFIGKRAIKKYLPAAIFICTITSAIDLFGEKKKLWRFYRGIPPLNSMNFFNFGPYFVTSLCMLRMTYGNFLIYMIVNFVLHFCFIFLGGVKLVDRLCMAK